MILDCNQYNYYKLLDPMADYQLLYCSTHQDWISH